MTMLCVAPLRTELDGLCAGFVALGYDVAPRSTGRLEAWHVPQLDLVLARSGHGKTQFSVQTQHLLDHLPGIAGVLSRRAPSSPSAAGRGSASAPTSRLWR